MSVRLEAHIHRYIGQSTDEKPAEWFTDTEGNRLKLPPGSSFLESDTGRIFRWTGERWEHGVTENTTDQLLSAILCELQEINQRFELATA